MSTIKCLFVAYAYIIIEKTGVIILSLLTALTLNAGRAIGSALHNYETSYTPLTAGQNKEYSDRLAANASIANVQPITPSAGAAANPGQANGGGAAGGSGVSFATNSTPAPINNAQIGQINDELGRLGTQESIGRGNLDRSYNANRNALQSGLNSAEGQYNTTLARTQQDNMDAKGQIDQGVRSGLSGLQRLLGAAGAGNSSAAHVLAPYAAGLAGNTQRQAVNKAYGRNTEDLNAGIADTRQQYKDKFGQLDSDKANKLNSLLAGLADTRAQLLSSRQAAGGGDQSAQIRALHNQIDQYGNQSVFDPGQVAYHAPNLQDYSFDQTAAAQVGDPNQAGIASNVGSYYNLLNPNKDKKTILGA